MLVRLTRLCIQPAQESLHCNANLQRGMQSWNKISVQTHTIRPGLSWKAPYGKFETRGVTSKNNMQSTLSSCATRFGQNYFRRKIYFRVSDKITSAEQPFALFHSGLVFVERINLRLRKSNRRRASILNLCFTHASVVAWITDSRHPPSPEWSPAGFCVFLDPEQVQIFVKNLARIRSHFLFSSVAGYCVVFANVMPYVQTLLNFGCIDGSRLPDWPFFNLASFQVVGPHNFSCHFSLLLASSQVG